MKARECTCENCEKLRKIQSAVLRAANPPFSHADDNTIRIWNDAVRDFPCLQKQSMDPNNCSCYCARHAHSNMGVSSPWLLTGKHTTTHTGEETMRKITEQVATALLQCKTLHKGNDEVHVEHAGTDYASAELHYRGNCIAYHVTCTHRLYLYDAGLQFAMIKDRLNGVLLQFNLPWRIYQTKQWHVHNYNTGTTEAWKGAMSIALDIPIILESPC